MFIPRHPVVENQFCQFWGQTTVSGGAGDVLAYAGSVCYLDGSATDATVKIYAANENQIAFGFLMQKVKTGYHTVHPAGFMMPGDLGSSDVIAQPSYNSNGVINGSKPAPVAIAHLGIWDTIHYYGSGVINAGVDMFIRQSSSSELCDTGATKNTGNIVARSTTPAGVVASVVKGASAAQVTANNNNTTLYPIRVKLLV
jgi:hypothetical protein